MGSATHSMRDVEATAERLQGDLARLQLQKQALERELAAVVAHLGSVRQALGAFETLLRTPAATEQVTVPRPAAGEAEVAVAESATVPAPPAPGAWTSPAETEDTDRPAPAEDDTDEQQKYGRLTEQIMKFFASAGDTDVRARDVAAALGRDTDSGTINGVRSTLDRLVGASRIQRTGRGLYRARRS
ncbi:hypothetical protein ABZ642_15885 [Streptomyces sp. NPDC007157]|uniref:hypothetical protein n=1 Tax=Streptomyces sp. NPDC007157 TaxID=3154681 RepID=UPI0033FC3AAD